MAFVRVFHLIAMIIALTAFASPAHACVESAGGMSIFFAAKPARIPPELVVLKVQAPVDANAIGGTDVDILQAVDGVREAKRIRVLIEAPAQDCKDYDLGIAGCPAYIVGNYERAGDDRVVFRARWMPTNPAVRRRGKSWQSYVVDPAYLPESGAQ